MLLFQSRLSAKSPPKCIAAGGRDVVPMMKLSSTSDYGIRALVDLAQHHSGAPIPSAEIAERQGIPSSLAGQVLGRLRAAGFISSARGAQGGHQLAMTADLIRLDRVVEALEGPLTLAACLERTPGNSAGIGGRATERCTGAAAQVRLWDDVRAAILDVLANRTIADLAAESAQLDAISGGRYQI